MPRPLELCRTCYELGMCQMLSTTMANLQLFLAADVEDLITQNSSYRICPPPQMATALRLISEAKEKERPPQKNIRTKTIPP